MDSADAGKKSFDLVCEFAKQVMTLSFSLLTIFTTLANSSSEFGKIICEHPVHFKIIGGFCAINIFCSIWTIMASAGSLRSMAASAETSKSEFLDIYRANIRAPALGITLSTIIVCIIMAEIFISSI